MLALLIILFLQLASIFATNANYCTSHSMSDSVGHPGITIVCQSGD
jgi:hypothetical protein